MESQVPRNGGVQTVSIPRNQLQDWTVLPQVLLNVVPHSGKLWRLGELPDVFQALFRLLSPVSLQHWVPRAGTVPGDPSRVFFLHCLLGHSSQDCVRQGP